MLSKGHLLKTFGNLKESVKSYKSSYKIDKYFGDAYWSLANLKTYAFSDQEIKSLEKMVKDIYLNENEKTYMHFALGKAFEDSKDYQKSFHHYKAGNDIKKQNIKFDLKVFDEECINQKEVCTGDLFEAKKDLSLIHI